MRYLVTFQTDNEPFFTNWFDPENHFNKELKMIVFDLIEFQFTIDGVTWVNIPIDHL